MFTTIRKTIKLVGPTQRRRYIAIGVLSALVSGLEAFSALLVLVLMRFMLEPGRVPVLPVIGDPRRWFPGASYNALVLGAAVLFAGFFILRGAAFIFQQYAVARVSQNSGVLLSDRLVQGYLSMPYSLHLRRNSSELIRNAYENVQQLVAGAFTPLATLLAEGLLTLGMLGVLLAVSPLGTLVAGIVMLCVLLVTLMVIQPRLRRLGAIRQRAAKSSLQHLQQGLGGLRDVKVLGRERAFSRSFLHARSEMAKAQYKNVALASVPRVTIETAFLMLILAAIAWSVMTENVEAVVSTAGVFAYAGLRLQPSLQKVAAALNSLRFAEAILNDLQGDLTLFDRSTRHSDDPDPAPLPFEKTVVFDNVSFRYEGTDTDALVDIDFTLRKGEALGIAGATGGGKTTLLDVLCGLLPPTSGRITVDGVDVEKHVRAWQRNIGVVHQSSFLLDDTLRRNIALGLRDEAIDEDALAEAVRIAQLSEVVEGLEDGLDTLVGERGVRLSGGQRQRVTLARAVYRRPSLLILDEGTSALDNTTEAALVEAIQRLREDMTLVMVAHRLTTIMRCDRIIFLEHGRITGVGSYEDLKRDVPSFAAMTA